MVEYFIVVCGIVIVVGYAYAFKSGYWLITQILQRPKGIVSIKLDGVRPDRIAEMRAEWNKMQMSKEYYVLLHPSNVDINVFNGEQIKKHEDRKEDNGTGR